jgi:hypothetical protein
MKPNALCFFQVAAITFAALTGIQSSSAQMPIDANGLVDAYERGEGVVFHNRATGYSLQFRGLAQFTSETRHFSETDEWTTRFRARRIRMRWAGASSSQKFRYRVQYELSNPDGDGDDVSGMLMDAWCAYQPNNRFRITFGQRSAISDNLELRMGSNTLQFVERSRLTSAFGTIREFGTFAEGRLRAGANGWLKLAASVVTGDGAAEDIRNHGGLKYEGRVLWLPLGLFRSFGEFRQVDLVREVQPKIMLGAYGSLNQGMSSRRGRSSGDILYLDANFEEALPDYWKAGADLLFKFKGFTLLGEYTMTDANVPDQDIVQRVRNNGTLSTTFEGGVDAYVRGRMMLGTAFNVQAGYCFTNLWSVDVRYTRLSAPENSFLNNPTFYARSAYQDLGISKYFGRDYGAKLQFGITRTQADPAAITTSGNSFGGSEWTFRVLSQFSI